MLIVTESQPDPVVVVDYDPRRKKTYDQEHGALTQVFAGTGATIAHVGSTAIPDLGGKPVVDIVVGVESLDDVETRLKHLEEYGYSYGREQEKNIPERRFFRKPATGERQVHLHCVLLNSDFYRDHIDFRDYLRAHPETAEEYFELKKNLAEKLGHDRDAYTEAKTEFINRILRMARAAAA
jgi:GrpB-like predicted nucleotidyltransferase (UPF0157 family)